MQLKTFDEAITWCDKGLAVSLTGAEIIFLYSFLTILKTYPDLKGLDSSNNTDSRINITTFFNFPDMFRRYIRHLQCHHIDPRPRI